MLHLTLKTVLHYPSECLNHNDGSFTQMAVASKDIVDMLKMKITHHDVYPIRHHGY